jgi:MFS family permease
MPANPAGQTSATVEPGAGVRPGHPQGTVGRAGWIAWTVGVAAYVVAVVYRTSLGVCGIEAVDKFHITASALSTFSVVQVMLYASLQIPVGLLVDRFGARRVLSTGLVLLIAGQVGFAFATTFAAGLTSRAILGCGDAMAFVSVLRLTAAWFPGRRNAVMVQLTAQIGMGGGLLSTELLSRSLHWTSWKFTFASSAVLAVVMLVLVAAFMRNGPGSDGGVTSNPARRPPVRQQINAVWSEPGTRLGLWVHFTCQFPGMSFILLWGMPFLVMCQGLDSATASRLLSLSVIGNMVFGVLFGRLVSHSANARMPIVLSVVFGTGALWAVVLTWPGWHAPMPLLIALAVVLGSNGAACLIGLDYARPVNPPERTGTALGVVNMGGFTATTLAILGIGLALDWQTPAGTAYSPETFRLAFCVFYLLMAVGLVQILRLRPLAAAREAALLGRAS